MIELTHQIETQAVHAGFESDDHFGAVSTPIYMASTYAFPNAEQGAAIHEGEQPGYFYSRMGNPTQQALEEAVAVLEGGEAALAFSSGMGAISNVLMTLLKSGDHIVAPLSIYSSTGALLKSLGSDFGIEVTFVDHEVHCYQEAIRPNTRLLYLETPSNPTLKVTDIKAIAELARQNDLLTICDNTFATPYNQRPLSLGADIVVHSMTKYIGGHGDILAGVAIGSGELIDRCRWTTNKLFGAVPAAHTSWLALRGIKTLALRMERHNENALAVAEFLEDHTKVGQVYYPGLKSHPDHFLACQQMRGFGGMVSFDVNGIDEGRKLVNHVKLCTLAVSLGDVATLIQHSATMTHASVDPEQRKKAGITDGLIRLSVGIESKTDIIEDLNQALKHV